jgi:hypothetical protein
VAQSTVTIVPDLRDASTHQSKDALEARAALKSRIDDAKSLGLVRISSTELLVIYDGKAWIYAGFMLRVLTSGL